VNVVIFRFKMRVEPTDLLYFVILCYAWLYFDIHPLINAFEVFQSYHTLLYIYRSPSNPSARNAFFQKKCPYSHTHLTDSIRGISVDPYTYTYTYRHTCMYI